MAHVRSAYPLTSENQSPSPAAVGQPFSKPVRAGSLTTNGETGNERTLDAASAQKGASAGAAHGDSTCSSGSVALVSIPI